jgi:hypothetical protein
VVFHARVPEQFLQGVARREDVRRRRAGRAKGHDNDGALRGLSVDQTFVFRRVQRYAPELDKRMRPHVRMSGTSHRLDETCVKVGKERKYPFSC